MDDALADIAHREIFDAEFARVGFERCDLLRGFRIGDAARAIGGGHIVIGDRKGQIGTAHFAARRPQAFEGLRARHLVDEMAVDIKHARFARRFMDQMRIPDFVVECFCHGRSQVFLSRNNTRPAISASGFENPA